VTPSGQTVSGQRRSGFIERTLVDLNNVLDQTLFAESIARQKGLLQRLDARLKLFCLLLFVLAVSLSHSLLVIASLYAGTLLLAAGSRIPFGTLIKRTWVFIPFFTGLIALPALFITPGPAWLRLPLGLAITQTGARAALFLLLRVGTSVSLGTLLVLTTPWNSILKALGALHIPDVIVLVLGMTYRYIYLLLHLTGDMFLSRKSRILKPLPPAEARRLAAAIAGELVGKSLQVSSDVYLAMQARGYRGVPQTMHPFRMRKLDWLCAVLALLIAAAAIWVS
jgi:cobalt/nickel transport system permease protein